MKKKLIIISIVIMMSFVIFATPPVYAANWSGSYRSKNLGYSSGHNANYLCLILTRKSKKKYGVCLFASRSSLYVNKTVKLKKGRLSFTDPETNGKWVIKRVRKGKLKVVKTPNRNYKVNLYKEKR